MQSNSSLNTPAAPPTVLELEKGQACEPGLWVGLVVTPIGLVSLLTTKDSVLRVELPQGFAPLAKNNAGIEVIPDGYRSLDLSACPDVFQRAAQQLSWVAHGFDVSILPPLPLAINQGTDFQQAVWQEIARIPFGETITYSELAQQIGKPLAFRAAASACGKNPHALLVPCHRVVAAHGLGGFGKSNDPGMLRIKRFLLAQEGHNF